MHVDRLDQMTRYFCHFGRDGAVRQDVRGFIADDDAEAIEVARAIAHVMISGDPEAGWTAILLLSEGGSEVLSSTLEAFITGSQ